MKPLYCEETAWLAKIRQRKSLEPKAAGNPNFDFSFFIQTRQKARVIGSSLVIDVIGPLYGDGVPLNEVLGGTNYQSIVKEIKGTLMKLFSFLTLREVTCKAVMNQQN